MIRAYFISVIVTYMSFVLFALLLQNDVKSKGINTEKSTLGENVAAVIQSLILFSIPIFNIMLACIIWFNYDKVLEKRIKEGE